jgi:quercetin dioxygenase-like cupin family protein
VLTRNIREMQGGWFIGDFEPSVLRTGTFEVAHHRYPAGYRGEPHVHRFCTEYNYILRGRLVASGQELSTGDIFVYAPGEASDVEFLEESDLVIVKTPSVPGDKHAV